MEAGFSCAAATRNRSMAPLEVADTASDIYLVEETGVLFLEILFRSFGDDIEAQSGSFEQVDHRILHDLRRQANNDVLPPWVGGARVLEGDIVSGQVGADVDQRAKAEQTVRGAVRRHQD